MTETNWSTLEESLRVESKIKTQMKRRTMSIEREGYKIMGKRKCEDCTYLEQEYITLEQIANMVDHNNIPRNNLLILVPGIESSTQPPIYTDGLFHPTFKVFNGRYLVYYKRRKRK